MSMDLDCQDLMVRICWLTLGSLQLNINHRWLSIDGQFLTVHCQPKTFNNQVLMNLHHQQLDYVLPNRIECLIARFTVDHC